MIQNSLDIVTVVTLGVMLGAGVYALGFRHGVKVATSAPIEPLFEPSPSETRDAPGAQQLIVAKWLKWNPWYRDPILALEAQIVHLQLQKTNPGQPLEENLAGVTREVRRRHPEIMTLN